MFIKSIHCLMWTHMLMLIWKIKIVVNNHKHNLKYLNNIHPINLITIKKYSKLINKELKMIYKIFLITFKLISQVKII
jgi:hypothetical protein